MSICYDIYLEGRVDEKWKALGPWFAMPDESFALAPIMSGYSAVREMVDCVEYRGGWPHDLSDEVNEKIVFESSDGEQLMLDCKWFPSSALSRIDVNRFEFEGYVPRQQVAEYERGDADCINDWLGAMEYAALPAAEKQGFTYYRWTEPGGTYDLRVELKQRAAALCDMYGNCWNEGGCLSKPDDVRFIVVAS